MLTERYRPKTLEDIIGQRKIVEAMRGFVAKKDLPNCLYVGKSGTGKTAMAHAVKNELGLNTQDLFMELNASDERKIDVIREKVKNFARQATYSGVPFKIMLLDEIDGMLKASQQALRRIMESYYKSVRFIITSNVISTVSQALVSRCAVFQFRALTDQQLEMLLGRVLRLEEKMVPLDVCKRIAERAEGDARLAINSLEAILSLDGPTEEDVDQFIGRVTEGNLYKMIGEAKKGSYKTFIEMMNLLNAGASANQIMRQIWYSMLSPRVFGFTDNQRARMLVHLGSLPGADDNMRLTAFLAKVIADERMRV